MNRRVTLERVKATKTKYELYLKRLRAHRELMEDSDDDTLSIDKQISFFEEEIKISEAFIARES